MRGVLTGFDAADSCSITGPDGGLVSRGASELLPANKLDDAPGKHTLGTTHTLDLRPPHLSKDLDHTGPIYNYPHHPCSHPHVGPEPAPSRLPSPHPHLHLSPSPPSLPPEPGEVGFTDNTGLVHLNEPSILNNTRVRFAKDQIYTFTGRILVAVNPFKLVGGLYGEAATERFAKQACHACLQPHPAAALKPPGSHPEATLKPPCSHPTVALYPLSTHAMHPLHL